MNSPRSTVWLACLSLTVGCFISTPTPAQTNAPARPKNVLFIVSDDLWTGLGCYGDTQVKTPNIDKLAGQSLRFDRAYCQYPVCNPSRSSFLSGRRPDYLGIFDNLPNRALHLKFPDLVTLPQLFRQNGYFTASLGKIFHCGVDADGKPVTYLDAKSFEVNQVFKATPLGLKGEGRNLTGGKLFWCSWLAANGTDEDQPDGQIATAAIKLIEAHKDQPFFIGVGFHKPHDPFHAPKKYFDLFPLDKIQLAQEPSNRTPDLPLAIPLDWKATFDKFTDVERREFRRAYFACMAFTDAQVGRVLDTLDRLGLANDTIVVFLGDNGYQLGEHGWWNKNTNFELSARVPLILRVPGAMGMGHSTRGLVEFVDLYPTLTELAGLIPPTNLEGKSFRDLLENPALAGKPAAFTQVARGKVMGRSVRTARWRYTEWGSSGAEGIELYDQENDPGDYQNLADKPEFAETCAEMKKLLASGTH